MTRLRNPRRSSSASVAQGRPRGTYKPGGPGNPGCVASDGCTRDVVPDCPVRLCAKHMREVYTYVHDIVMDEVARQAARLD